MIKRESITVFVTTEEKLKIKILAAQQHTTISNLVRKAISELLQKESKKE